MSCDWVEREEVAESYVLGELREVDAVRYELHFLECDRCFLHLEVRRTLRRELRRRAETTDPSGSGSP